MKITPVTAPSAPQQSQGQGNQDARARAIAALTSAPAPQEAPKPNTQEYAVANPNNISPEEQSAVVTKTTESLDNTATVEETQPKAPEKDPEVVKQFAEIARQERILRAKAQKQQTELAQQKADLDAQKAALDVRTKEYEQGYISKDRFKLDPLSALEEAGLTYDELTQRAIDRQPKNPVVDAELKALRDELKALRAGLDDTKQSAAKAQADSYQQALTQLKTDTTKLVKGNAEYEAIDKTDAIQDVVDLIEQVYKRDGIIMTVQEAAQEVENYLVEESFSTVTRIDKIKKRLAEANASTATAKPVNEDTKPKEEVTSSQMKTLTNATASTRKLSARERALLAFKGELKS